MSYRIKVTLSREKQERRERDLMNDMYSEQNQDNNLQI